MTLPETMQATKADMYGDWAWMSFAVAAQYSNVPDSMADNDRPAASAAVPQSNNGASGNGWWDP